MLQCEKHRKVKLCRKTWHVSYCQLSSRICYLVDIGFIWWLATPTPADREIVLRYRSEYTWGDFGKEVVSMIASWHLLATKIVCSNDLYNVKYKIKDDERDRTSKNLKYIPNIPFKSADKFPSSTQFTSILSNSRKKVWLQQFIEMKLKEYSSTTVTDYSMHRPVS